MLILSDEAFKIRILLEQSDRDFTLANFHSQFSIKETEKYVNESSFIRNSAGLMNTFVFL